MPAGTPNIWGKNLLQPGCRLHHLQALPDLSHVAAYESQSKKSLNPDSFVCFAVPSALSESREVEEHGSMFRVPRLRLQPSSWR
jgi:hypothetical protein